MVKRSDPPSASNLSSALPDPDYEHWGAEDLWILAQAAALLMGWEPMPNGAIPDGPGAERFKVIQEKLQRDTGKTTTCFDYASEHGYRYYPWVVIEWAESNSVSVPHQLKTAVINAWPSHFRTGAHLTERDRLKQQIAELESQLAKAADSAQPAYLREAHKFFSLELSAAVAAWTALFESRQVREGAAVKPQLLSWLRQTFNPKQAAGARLSESAIDRIATVANPHKKGGAPRTPEKT